MSREELDAHLKEKNHEPLLDLLAKRDKVRIELLKLNVSRTNQACSDVVRIRRSNDELKKEKEELLQKLAQQKTEFDQKLALEQNRKRAWEPPRQPPHQPPRYQCKLPMFRKR